MAEVNPMKLPWHGVRYRDHGEGITPESIRHLLEPWRRRHIVFFHEDDRDIVTETCRRLRDEGHEIVEKQSRFVESGQVIGIDADVLQMSPFKPLAFENWLDA